MKRFAFVYRLFAPLPPGARWYQVILWWELRRIAYNLLILIAGLISIAVFIYFASKRPDDYQDGPEPIAALVTAFAANLIYTASWPCELLVRVIWGDRARKFGPIAFAAGLVFSVALSALPPIVAGMNVLFTERKQAA
jgi:hypothetical protein